MKQIIIIIVLTSLIIACKNDTSPVALPTKAISSLSFNGHLASDPNEPSHKYSLIGRGFMQPESFYNTDSLIYSWLKAHPNAIAKIICTISAGDTTNAASMQKMSYIWVEEGDSSLNEELVKQGCFRRNMMFRPKSWKEMTKAEQAGYANSLKPNTTVYVDSMTYNSFLNEIESAELNARTNKLGLWSIPWTEEDNLEVNY